MKKLKEANPYSYSVLEDPNIRFKHESLLLDFEDLQKDTEAMKKKLRIMKQKKQSLAAEVGFLKQRYNYLKSNPNLTRRESVDDKKGKNSLKKKTLGPSTNKKGKKIYDGTETQIFDLNQKARFLLGRGFTTSKSSNFNLNQGKRIHGGSEAGKRIVAPIFDLNQVSTEEEELQVAIEEPLKIEEMPRSYLRDEDGDEHRAEMKMSICRNSRNGSRRVGKRKISWQDQVALRV